MFSKWKQEELFVCIWVGWLINCKNPFEDVNQYNFVLSEVSSDHYDKDLTLKSPVTTDTGGVHLLMSFKSGSRFDKNESNSVFFGLESNKLQKILSFYYDQLFLRPVLL